MFTTKKRLWVIPIITLALTLALVECGGEETPGETSRTDGPPTVAEYDALNLYSTTWDTDSSGQSYGSADQIKLSDFSTVKPKQGDVLKFKISGTSSKELKNFQITLFQMQGTNWDTYKWLGASSCVTLPSSFNDYTTDEVTLYNAPNSNAIYVSLNDVLWQKDSDGNYTVGDGSERFPSSTKNGDIIATITNFSISLVKDSGNGTPGVNSGGDGWLGNTLTITNAQVYEYDGVNTFSPSNKTVTGLSYVVQESDYSIKSLTEIINGSPSVTLKNGKLNISMGTPKASALTTFNTIVGSSGINSSAKIFRFLFIYNNLNFDDDTISILQISESGFIEYWYCDRDVNISAKFIYEDDRAPTSYALNLKTGWNSVIPSYKMESEGNYIETISTGKPSSNSRWIMEHMSGSGSDGGGGGIPPVVVGGSSDNQP
jgi:hypothetical protein